MTIKVKQGNVIDAMKNDPNGILLHVTNCQGSMGSGIALEIRNRFPDTYEAYMNMHRTFGLKLGQVTYNPIYPEVLNMNAQMFYGTDGARYLNYGALAERLHKVKLMVENSQEVNFYIPYLMGCDRAGGNWEIVSELVEYILGDKHNIVAYKL